MQSIIKELWYGNIHPQEDGIFKEPQFKELLGHIARHRVALEKSMTEEQLELLEKMMDNRNEFDGLAEAEVFACGFRLGANIMLAIMSNEEQF